MSEYSNTVTEILGIEAFREARKCLIDMKPGQQDATSPVRSGVGINWHRLEREDPNLFMGLLSARAEGAGQICLPVEIYNDMLARGLLKGV